MKVFELIEKLEGMDRDADVLMWQEVDSSGRWLEVSEVTADVHYEEPENRYYVVCLE